MLKIPANKATTSLRRLNCYSNNIVKLLNIIRPHRISSEMWPIATDGVVWSVYESVTIVSHAKVAEPIMMLFTTLTRVDPKYPVLNEVQIPTRAGAILRAKRDCVLDGVHIGTTWQL